ncbi:MAG: CRISPR-associated protein Cas6, partial [Campylobacter sp.]|nr:CRISPR-associated protein Cas6 [Campylobacter sp.]
MIIINSTLPTTNIKIAKSLPRLIQGYIYHHLPNCEHEGYKHKSGKIFKKMNFDFYLKNSSLR